MTEGKPMKDTTVKLPVTVAKNPGRGSGWTATYGDYPHDLWAEGPTEAAAKDALTAKITTALAAIMAAKPSFARDADNAAMWVAVPAADGGCREWRVTDVDAWGGTSSSNPADDAFAACVGLAVIPRR
jgi:hypothetical protein